MGLIISPNFAKSRQKTIRILRKNIITLSKTVSFTVSSFSCFTETFATFYLQLLNFSLKRNEDSVSDKACDSGYGFIIHENFKIVKEVSAKILDPVKFVCPNLFLIYLVSYHEFVRGST